MPGSFDVEAAGASVTCPAGTSAVDIESAVADDWEEAVRDGSPSSEDDMVVLWCFYEGGLGQVGAGARGGSFR